MQYYLQWENGACVVVLECRKLWKPMNKIARQNFTPNVFIVLWCLHIVISCIIFWLHTDKKKNKINILQMKMNESAMESNDVLVWEIWFLVAFHYLIAYIIANVYLILSRKIAIIHSSKPNIILLLSLYSTTFWGLLSCIQFYIYISLS